MYEVVYGVKKQSKITWYGEFILILGVIAALFVVFWVAYQFNVDNPNTANKQCTCICPVSNTIPPMTRQ